MKISEAAKALVRDYIAITAHDPAGELKSIAIVPVSRVVELRAALEADEPTEDPYKTLCLAAHVVLDKLGTAALSLPDRVSSLASAYRAAQAEALRILEERDKAREERDTFRTERDAALAVISRDTGAIREIQADRDAAQKRIAELEAERDAARNALERERVRLAGCGVLALCNTHEALAQHMPAPDAYGYSASLEAVATAIRREIAQRERAEKAEAEAERDAAKRIPALSRIAELEAEAATLRANLEATQRAAGEWQDDSRELGAVKVALNAAGAPATDVHGVTMSTATRVRRIITDLKREANQARDEARKADAKLDQVRDAIE